MSIGTGAAAGGGGTVDSLKNVGLGQQQGLSARNLLAKKITGGSGI